MTTIQFTSLFLAGLVSYFLGYALFAYKGNLKQWLSDRADRIEARKAAEHRRAIEVAEAGAKTLEVAFAGMLAMLEKHYELKSNLPTSPPGGIVHPNPAVGDECLINGHWCAVRAVNNQKKTFTARMIGLPDGKVCEAWAIPFSKFVPRNQPTP